MKIVFLSVGKAHETYVKEGIELFCGRIKHYYENNWQLIAPAKNAATLPITEQKTKEGIAILAALEKDDYVVLLDETGKNISSIDLANLIQQQADFGKKRMVFIIGGAFGVSEEIKSRANFIWSISKAVFPHQLVRLILAEQFYRACTINRNEKYHHL